MTNKQPRKSPLWLLTLTFVYVAILAAFTILNQIGAELWWLGALNLYLPQILWAVPGILLAAFGIKMAPQWFWVPLLGTAWVLGPIMGFCWPLHTIKKAPGSLPLRVMTWNVKYGSHDSLAHSALMNDIDLNNPTVVLLQDAGGMMNGPLGNYFSKWNVRSYGQFIIASKFPLGELQVRPLFITGEEHTFIRTLLQIGGRTVTLYNVHLLTPREGLNALREVKEKPWYLPKAIHQFENNVDARLSQAQALKENVRQEKGPVIVAGDLNSPDASQACAELRDVGLHDAFAEGGKGYGYTYGHFLLQHRFPTLNVSWMRIDHIMVSSQIKSQHCWTGTAKASDHRPVIADLVLNYTSRTGQINLSHISSLSMSKMTPASPTASTTPAPSFPATAGSGTLYKPLRWYLQICGTVLPWALILPLK